MNLAERFRLLHTDFERQLGPDWRDKLTLVAVSKSTDAQRVREAFALGQRDFGENRVQELIRKQELLSDLAIRWHFIGHLQTNKVRHLTGRAELIHSVDSTRLAEAIARESEKKSIASRILIEVKTTGEENKTGCSVADLPQLVRDVLDMDRLILDGLMTMGPLEGGAEAARPCFKLLHTLHEELRGTPGLGYRGAILSMGMSDDYPIAIDEGSTMVRIGSRIFKP